MRLPQWHRKGLFFWFGGPRTLVDRARREKVQALGKLGLGVRWDRLMEFAYSDP